MQFTWAKPCPDVSPMWELQPAIIRRWYAAYTLPRHEKAVAEQLQMKDIESFVPLYLAVHNWKGRRAQVQLPLFPGYVFVNLPLSLRVKVLEQPSVLRIVSFNGAPAAIPDEQMENLRRAVSLRRAQPYPYTGPGKRIRIQSGPLTGLEGKVVRRKGNTRLVISLDAVHRSFIVDLDISDLAIAAD